VEGREDNMADWIIKSKDVITGRIGENRYTTEAGFITALGDLFRDLKQQFVSATSADGKALDEATAGGLAGFTIGESGIGERPL
jgi:hypothetical protein